MYPCVIGVSVLGTSLAIAQGYDGESAAVLLGVLGALAVAAAERVIPWAPAWRESHGDSQTDGIHVLVSGALIPGVIRALAYVPIALAGRNIAGLLGAPSLWPTRWPMALQVLLALVISDFFGTVAHLAMHRSPWLWRLHAIHHDAPRLYWLNGLRVHPIDAAMTMATTILPLIFLGISPNALALFAAIATPHIALQHANLDLRLGWLSPWISAGDAHRWHHARDRTDSDANYGGIILLWDAVFGTRKLHADRAPSQDVGIAQGPLATRWWGQVRAPFERRWWVSREGCAVEPMHHSAGHTDARDTTRTPGSLQ